MTQVPEVDSDQPAIRPALTRSVLRSGIARVLDDTGVRWAWQGPVGAGQKWDADTGPADLDIWWDPDLDQRGEVLQRLAELSPFAVVAEARDPRRLRHLSLAFEVAGSLAVVDLTQGDLRVGAVLLSPARQVHVTTTTDGPRLAATAGAADLLVRPLLRGKLPPADRIGQARNCWAESDSEERVHAHRRWRKQLGKVADSIVEVLAGAEPDADLPRSARRALLRRTLGPSGVAAAWSQRWSVVPAGSAAGPLGLRTRGVLVALVGTDGSGKSTVADELSTRLTTLGMTTASAYFGMARGNLPGVSLARKLLGVRSEPADPEPAPKPEPPQDPEPAELADQPEKLAHPGIRKIAAWFYAAEYTWRYASKVAPRLRRRQVVICDRYVYDLRDSPWPGSPAAAAVAAIVPAPDVLILPDAPPAVIHARKPERPQWQQARQQADFRALLAERPARVAELILDTSGATSDPVAAAVAAVVRAAHQPRGSRRE
jgi:thymidylate kinase